jgi:hypothetical protein
MDDDDNSSNDYKQKSKKIYGDFKKIVKHVMMNNMETQFEKIKELINDLTRLTNESERIKVYHLSLYDLGLSLNNSKFNIDKQVINQLCKEQSGGAVSPEFAAITERLKDRLIAMKNLSDKLEDTIRKIMKLIGDSMSSDGLINIRLKID